MARKKSKSKGCHKMAVYRKVKGVVRKVKGYPRKSCLTKKR